MNARTLLMLVIGCSLLSTAPVLSPLGTASAGGLCIGWVTYLNEEGEPVGCGRGPLPVSVWIEYEDLLA